MDIYVVHAVQDGGFFPIQAFFDEQRALECVRLLTEQRLRSGVLRQIGYVSIATPVDATPPGGVS